MQSELIARLKSIIADAEADMAEHFSDAEETGERADLSDTEVCLPVEVAQEIVDALSAADPVAFVCPADMELLAKSPDGWDFSMSPKARPDLGMNMALYAAPPPETSKIDPVLWVSPVDLKAWERAKAGEIWAWSENIEGQCIPLYAAPPALSAQVQDVGAVAQLNAIVDAWEALPGGRRVRNSDVEAWLAEDMAPAINAIRAFLQRPRPDGVIPAAPAKQEGTVKPNYVAELVKANEELGVALSEAEQREKDARVKALDEAAKVADDQADKWQKIERLTVYEEKYAASTADDASRDIAAAIRALKDEVR